MWPYDSIDKFVAAVERAAKAFERIATALEEKESDDQG